MENPIQVIEKSCTRVVVDLLQLYIYIYIYMFALSQVHKTSTGAQRHLTDFYGCKKASTGIYWYFAGGNGCPNV